MKVLVTGHNGFIGGALYQKLKFDGHDVLGVDKKENIDIADHGILPAYLVGKQFEPEIIVHCAANCSTPRSVENPRQDFYDNVIGTFNVCELSRFMECKHIFISSCKAGTGTPYGTSKLTGELYVKEYFDTYGIEYIINRPGTVYGEGQEGSEESGWLGWFIKASILGKPIKIYGDGKQSRDVLYINDLIELLVKQVTNFNQYKNNLYSVGGGEKNEITLLQALDLLNYSNYLFEPPRVGDVKRFVAENNIPNWKPKTYYRDGIEHTKKYFRSIL